MSPTFADLGVPAPLCATLAHRGIAQPFPIQAATLPDALAGRDVAGKAPTGSGKTLAFGLTIAAHVATLPDPQLRRPWALVLVPTRELAAQVQRELAGLVDQHRSGPVAAIYGGVGYGPQRKLLARGVSAVVACPGRLEDLVASGDIRLDGVELVVVDEADRMADMGFLPAVRRLLDLTSPRRQTLLFSATLDRDVDTLVSRYQRDPAQHVAGDTTGDGAEVTHLYWTVDQPGRVALTADIVRHTGPTIVFCRTRHGVDRVARQLRQAGVKAEAIHGRRTQAERHHALHSFTSGKSPALVATDVAARGIHVDGVACVVHFDLAGDAKDYVHRSGRTGRAGAAGVVVSLVTPGALQAVRSLQRDLERTEPIEAPEPDHLVGRGRHAAPPAAAPGSPDRSPERPPAPRRHARDRRMVARRDDRRLTGTVKSFHPARGYGFIARRGAADVFVHVSGLGGRHQTLEAGQRVRFEVAPGRRGQQAVNVQPV
jgi:superfamily II DNA/RNA helicase